MMNPGEILIAAIVMVACVLACAVDARGDGVAPPGTRVKGEFAVEGDDYVAKAAMNTIAVGDANSSNYRVTWQVKLDPTKANSVVVRILPEDALDYNKGYALSVQFHAPQDNVYITCTPWRFGADGKPFYQNARNYNYAPYAADAAGRAAALKELTDQGFTANTYVDRWIPMRADVVGNTLVVWIEGVVADLERLPKPAKGDLAIDLWGGQRIRNLKVEKIELSERMVPLDMSALANDKFAQPLIDPANAAARNLKVGNVPFELAPAGGKDQVSLRRAGWAEWKKDPQDYYEKYDAGPEFVNDPRMPFLRVPADDYTAVHLLAVADDAKDTIPIVNMRAGKYGYSGQVMTFDFEGTVPRQSESAGIDAARVVTTLAGPLYHVRVPWTEAIAQDMGDGITEVALTKQIYLAVHLPDPNRFRYRDLGPSSGVRIAAITFERSPLQMKVTTKESANAFIEPQKPTVDVRLTNITTEDQPYNLQLDATHLHGTKAAATKSGTVKAGETITESVPMDLPLRGYYDLVVTLSDGKAAALLTRHTSLAVLPPDTRQYRAESPFGTWDFGPTHYSNPDTERSMSLTAKMGLCYTGGGTPELRAKYGLRLGSEISTAGNAGPEVKSYADFIKRNPDSIKMAMIFHETSVDYESVLRIPDFFVNWPKYEFSEATKKSFATLWAAATTAGKTLRKDFPDAKITFGNGTLATRAQFWEAKFPAEYFDYCGNEAPSFGRLPESQPPDVVSNNASFFMDRQMLDHYGYKDKPIQHCYEATYVGTNPGNVNLRDQADHYVRHCLHAMAWNFPYIRYGCANDMGNSYYYSNWGATGFCTRYPEVAPKPSYVAMATMTLMLDGASFVRDIETGSASVYAMEFNKRDGTKVWALWTTRGQRDVGVRVSDAGEFTVTNDQAIGTPAKPQDGRMTVGLSPSPVYLSGKGEITAIELGTPKHDERPTGKTTKLSTLASMDDWTVQTDRDPYLEFYSMLCPRRKGDFEFAAVGDFEGRSGVMRVTPKPITVGKEAMPMYAAIEHKTGVAVEREPTEVGIWVNGNSSFGRIFFEFTDASGQKWTSIGAPSVDAPPSWMKVVVPAELQAKFTPPQLSDWNTDDVFGWSRINFDGWRYVSFPLPGQYPGEGYHWPANTQWRWDKDGKVHYPLTFKRLIVELPEKTLHVKTYAPVARHAIYLQDLVVSQGSANWRKTGVHEVAGYTWKD